MLLAANPDRTAASQVVAAEAGITGDDPIHAEIERVESELDRALGTLDGWTEGALPWEGGRFEELKAAWRVQAERIRELSALLSASDDRSHGDAESASETDALSPVSEDRWRQSETARRENVERLRALHRRMQDDLLGNLAWVRELVTLIHLAKYTGAPASRAEELVAQIAAAVEGLSQVSDWQSGEAVVATTAAD